VSAVIAAELALAMLGLAAILGLVRLARGPSRADRVVALELLSTIAIGLVAAAAVVAGTSALLDVALILALVSFLGTVAFARYIEGGGE
jgi:multicomponent Na+:H+ antiporter subunit F